MGGEGSYTASAGSPGPKEESADQCPSFVIAGIDMIPLESHPKVLEPDERR